ncbi:STAS domain-containing protein [Novosphingobium sp.]|uniref:STAS domain-containing protein n=1 Tax=Novosphingobium sp. TaxID=1874826 RepID=UPI002B4A429C|nr:STAS domain-containing protein [Novosphingobium sp.]HKR91278.1 STAS domain-containing protein [Novosphingobium sp.]
MSTVTLPARCDRAAAEAIWPELVAALGNGAIRIDGTTVDHIGQAVLQLLVSARRSGEGAVIAPSAALKEAARLTGLASELFEENEL